MPAIQFGQRDLLRDIVLEPAWYRVRIEEVGENPSKDGDSTNYPVEGTILFNADTGSRTFEKDGIVTPCEGVPLTWNFNSKAIGFAVGFLKAFGVEPEAGKRYELKFAKNKELDVFVENGEYQGRMRNQVNHKYRTPRSE